MNRLCYKLLLKNLWALVKAQFCNFRESDLQYILILSFTNTKAKWVIFFFKKALEIMAADTYHRYLEKEDQLWWMRITFPFWNGQVLQCKGDFIISQRLSKEFPILLSLIVLRNQSI